ncbi:MAG: acetylxylan esterase, partial [Thermoleophilia bacterium]|nr:acetylxylan esterase [Thermoleophilia bacterium]
MLRRAGTFVHAGLAPLLVAATAAAQTPDGSAQAVRAIEPRVLKDDDRGASLDRHARERLRAANLRESKAWAEVRTADDWARFRAARLEALRESLGAIPRPGGTPKALVTGRHDGDGYIVENLVYESRPGGVVTANLYRPAAPPGRSPAILIAHSHHNPKTQGELQDMGMTWARAGVIVLVPDLPGHGERRNHPFRSAADHAGPFRVGRQDYYFRANAGVQLAVAGESLMGWMVRDLTTGVDLLTARPDVDPARIILLGSVAGGGDPAGVTAALDDRIAAVA